jgi:hypothetical protein
VAYTIVCRVPSMKDKIMRIMAGVVALTALAIGYFGPS